MDKKSNFGKNLRALRTAYGESMDELAYIINKSKSTISEYENGVKFPRRDSLEIIAKHFSVPIDVLVNADLSNFNAFRIDYTMLESGDSLAFPLFSSEEAMKNLTFKRTYERHRKELEAAASGRRVNLGVIADCTNVYYEIYEETKTCLEACANYLSGWFSFCILARGPLIIQNQNAFLMGAAGIYPKVRDLIDDFEEEDLKDAEEIDELLTSPDTVQKIFDKIKKLKASIEYAELADYYACITYYFGVTDNHLGFELNSRIGAEMLGVQAKLGNKYAEQFLNIVACVVRERSL